MFLVGAALSLRYPDSWLYPHFVRMLGDALAVGAVVAVTIELALVTSIIGQAAQAVADKLVGADLPPDLQEAVRKLIYETQFVMADSSVIYRINRIGDRRVKVSIQRRYRTFNYGRGRARYRPTIGDEAINEPRFISLDCSGVDVYHLSEEQLQPQIVPESLARNVFGRVTTLGSARIDDPNNGLLVVWQLEITCPDNYSDVTAFGGLTVGDFEIRVDDCPADIAFDATHDETMVHSEGSNMWRYRRAFMPGQHLRVWWRPRPRPDSLPLSQPGDERSTDD